MTTLQILATIIIALIAFVIYLIKKMSDFRRNNGYGRIFKKELEKLKQK